MHKVKLTLNRLAALTATSAFCLLATSCGDDAKDGKELENAKADVAALKTELGLYKDETITALFTRIGTKVVALDATEGKKLDDAMKAYVQNPGTSADAKAFAAKKHGEVSGFVAAALSDAKKDETKKTN